MDKKVAAPPSTDPEDNSHSQIEERKIMEGARKSHFFENNSEAQLSHSQYFLILRYLKQSCGTFSSRLKDLAQECYNYSLHWAAPPVKILPSGLPDVMTWLASNHPILKLQHDLCELRDKRIFDFICTVPVVREKARLLSTSAPGASRWARSLSYRRHNVYD